MGEFTWTHDSLPEASPLYTAAERASDMLRSMVLPGDYVAVRAQWVADSPTQDSLTLRLSDPYATVSETFRPGELTGDYAWFRVGRVYSRLLSERVKRTLERASENGPAAVEGVAVLDG